MVVAFAVYSERVDNGGTNTVYRGMDIPEKYKSRFWSLVTKTKSGCWLWNGSLNHNGYGTFSIVGKTVRAHRVSMVLSGSEIPDGMCVCHHCDVRNCVNPSHLFLGSQKDNARDAIEKGRHPLENLLIHSVGEDHWSSKLTAEKVLEMRSLHSKGFGFNSLGKKFGVSKFAAKKAVLKRTWAHI